MRKWTSALLLLLMFLVTAHAATAQVQVTQAYVYGAGAQRTATYPTGFQNVGTVFVVQNPPANSTWKLSYYNPDGSLVTTASGAYNNPAPQPGTTTTLAQVVPRGLVLTTGDWHIQVAINGQTGKDIYFSAGLNAPVLDHAIVIGSDYLTEKTAFNPGINPIGITAWVSNLPAGWWMRLRYQRPDGTIAADNTWDPQYPNGFSYGFMYMYNSVNLDQTGTWHLIYDLNGQTLATPTFTVTDLAIKAAKLGEPQIVTDSAGHNYLSVTVYLKGSGTGTLSGHWQLNEQDYQPINTTMDLSSGTWQKGPEFRLGWITSQINPTIRCVLDGSSSVQTGALRTWVTGFDPAVHGWQFPNFNGLTDLWSGLCLGMSALARNDYLYGPPISTENTITRWTWLILRSAHVTNNIYADGDPTLPIGGTDLRRLRGYPNVDTLIAAETNRLKDDIAAGRPNVMLLKPVDASGQVGRGKHAVVAIASFYEDDAYVPTHPDVLYNARVFAVYDPNYPGLFRHMYALETSGHYTFDSGYEGLTVLGEFTRDH